jgi:DNA polymerase I-like protein with 3'-5' exonuclease and polymerase domains
VAAGALLEEAPRLAADALKAIAVAVHERHKEIPGLEMVGLVHDEVLLLAPEEHADRAKDWLTGIMEGVGDSVVNGGRPPEERVPIVADTHVCTSWADKK